MDQQTRRTFLAASGMGLVAASTSAVTRARAAAQAADTVTVALIGCGSQGSGLVTKTLPSVSGARLAYVCDPDATRREKLQHETGAQQAVADLRRVLDDKDVDAVLIAAPDHWHVPAALLALEAGKHVYVEKPCSQNLREGLLLREAAHRTGRVVQHGTQSRSNPFIRTAIEALHGGIIGTVLAAKAWNVQLRDNIGHAQPSEAPPTLDYDLWVGPAEYMPFQANRFHYMWRWWFNFGTGDIGNDGTHEVDIARWGLGVSSFPSLVSGSGGKLFFDDDQQFPDTMSVSYEYRSNDGAPRLLTYEQRLWSTNSPYNLDNAVEFYGTKGRMLLSKRGKVEVLGERNKPIPFEAAPQDVSAHMADFIDAIRTGRTPNASADEAVASVALPHLGNIAVRTGRALRVDPQSGQISDDAEANALLSRKYRAEHWATPKELA